MNLPMVSILQCLVLGVHELGSFWMKLMGRCTPGMHQEGTAATIGASVAGITLEVIQSKEHLKCFFFFWTSDPQHQLFHSAYFLL